MKRPSNPTLRRFAVASALALAASVFATIVFPQQLTVFRGKTVSGSMSDLFQSDNVRLVVAAGPTMTPYEAPVDIRINALCSTPQPNRLILTMETKGNSPGLTQYVEMFEWNANTWVTLDQREVTLTDSTMNLDIPLCWRFANPSTGEMRMRYWVSATGLTSVSPWAVGIDQMHWDVDPQ